jgi:hypothetical protein
VLLLLSHLPPDHTISEMEFWNSFCAIVCGTQFWVFAEIFEEKSVDFASHDNTEQFRTITEYVCGNKRQLLYVIAEQKHLSPK